MPLSREEFVALANRMNTTSLPRAFKGDRLEAYSAGVDGVLLLLSQKFLTNEDGKDDTAAERLSDPA